mgnify:CR=1 FL=1
MCVLAHAGFMFSEVNKLRSARGDAIIAKQAGQQHSSPLSLLCARQAGGSLYHRPRCNRGSGERRVRLGAETEGGR